MNSKKIITVVLIIFVVISVIFLIIKENSGTRSQTGPVAEKKINTPAKEETSTEKGIKPDKVIVYYFHTDFRCPSCKKIEAFTDEAISGNFKDALKSGKVECKIVNIEKPENKHFTNDYKLLTKSVVLVGFKDGKEICHKNLEKVWELIGNKNEFIMYIRDELNIMMGEKV